MSIDQELVAQRQQAAILNEQTVSDIKLTMSMRMTKTAVGMYCPTPKRATRTDKPSKLVSGIALMLK